MVTCVQSMVEVTGRLEVNVVELAGISPNAGEKESSRSVCVRKKSPAVEEGLMPEMEEVKVVVLCVVVAGGRPITS